MMQRVDPPATAGAGRGRDTRGAMVGWQRGRPRRPTPDTSVRVTDVRYMGRSLVLRAGSRTESWGGIDRGMSLPGIRNLLATWTTARHGRPAARSLLKGHTDVVRCVGFSPDGELLASGSYDASVRLWEVASGRERALFAGTRAGSWPWPSPQTARCWPRAVMIKPFDSGTWPRPDSRLLCAGDIQPRSFRWPIPPKGI